MIYYWDLIVFISNSLDSNPSKGVSSSSHKNLCNSMYSHQAFYYDGTLTCYAGEHLILAIPAWFLFVLVVFILPGFITLISFKRFKVVTYLTQQLVTVILLLYINVKLTVTIIYPLQCFTQQLLYSMTCLTTYPLYRPNFLVH